jgi:phospholipid/cholesterol/gamma-HCH transport system substrate-binding protein
VQARGEVPMPSQSEVRWSQLKVGLIVLASLAVLCVLIFLMTSASGTTLFAKKLRVTGYFDNASGLKSGAPVALDGVTIGEVKHVLITTDPARRLTPVKVVMELSPRFQTSLHKDSVASLQTTGVIGDTMVDITSLAATGPQLENGDELKTHDSPSIQDVIKSSQATIGSLNEILAKLNHISGTIDSGQGSAGKLINDPALYDQAVSAVHQLNTLAMGLNQGRGSAGKLLTDDTVYNNLKDTTAKLDSIATGLSAGKGSAGKLLTDDTLYDNLNKTVTQMNGLLAQINSGQGGLGLILKNQEFAAHLNDTMTKLDQLLAGVSEGKGTLGKLATDDTAYRNLNELLTQSTQLMTMIRQDPRKYLTIHMKIF